MLFNIIFILYIGIYTYLTDSAKSSIVIRGGGAGVQFIHCWKLHGATFEILVILIVSTLFTLWTANGNVSVTNQNWYTYFANELFKFKFKKRAWSAFFVKILTRHLLLFYLKRSKKRRDCCRRLILLKATVQDLFVTSRKYTCTSISRRVISNWGIGHA